MPIIRGHVEAVAAARNQRATAGSIRVIGDPDLIPRQWRDDTPAGDTGHGGEAYVGWLPTGEGIGRYRIPQLNQTGRAAVRRDTILRGHELGHANFTPTNVYAQHNYPPSLVNYVEDARVNNLVAAFDDKFRRAVEKQPLTTPDFWRDLIRKRDATELAAAVVASVNTADEAAAAEVFEVIDAAIAAGGETVRETIGIAAGRGISEWAARIADDTKDALGNKTSCWDRSTGDPPTAAVGTYGLRPRRRP